MHPLRSSHRQISVCGGGRGGGTGKIVRFLVYRHVQYICIASKENLNGHGKRISHVLSYFTTHAACVARYQDTWYITYITYITYVLFASASSKQMDDVISDKSSSFVYFFPHGVKYRIRPISCRKVIVGKIQKLTLLNDLYADYTGNF